MKLNAALAKSLLIAASLGVVSSVFAQATDATPVPDAKKPATKTVPPKPVRPIRGKPTPAPKVETPPEIVLPGVVKPRPSGGFLTVEVVDGKFKIGFYDAKKKQMPLPAPRGTARWRSNRKISEERTVLSPGPDGKTLMSVGFVRPPFIFKVFLTLLNEEGAAVESHVIDLNPSARSDGTEIESTTK